LIVANKTVNGSQNEPLQQIKMPKLNEFVTKAGLKKHNREELLAFESDGSVFSVSVFIL
jgi:hypothetical protein